MQLFTVLELFGTEPSRM